MGEQRNEGLAPVTYLPWAVPSSGESDGGAAAPDRAAEAEERVEPAAARMSPRHPAGRGRSGRASNDESRPVERGGGRKARGLAVVGDAAPPETGIERDERIDRLIVSRLRRASLSIAEVRATLAEHGLDDHEIEEWIERYVRLGYLDDRRLAEQLVHSHGVRRGRGAVRSSMSSVGGASTASSHARRSRRSIPTSSSSTPPSSPSDAPASSPDWIPRSRTGGSPPSSCDAATEARSSARPCARPSTATTRGDGS